MLVVVINIEKDYYHNSAVSDIGYLNLMLLFIALKMEIVKSNQLLQDFTDSVNPQTDNSSFVVLRRVVKK